MPKNLPVNWTLKCGCRVRSLRWVKESQNKRAGFEGRVLPCREHRQELNGRKGIFRVTWSY